MKLLRLIDKYLEEAMCVVIFGVMSILTFAQVLSRFVFNFSLSWSEELARFSFVWLVYLAASMAIKHRRHIRVQVAEIFLPLKAAAWTGIISDAIWLGLTIIMTVQGQKVAALLLSHGQTSPAVSLVMGHVYTAIPLGFGLMSIRLVQQLYIRIKEVMSGNIEERKIAVD
ncbi:MAG: TRAP transporter small permease [Bacillota bacterium]|nr:TRAP transporter small permease [Bacillota bacterium]